MSSYCVWTHCCVGHETPAVSRLYSGEVSVAVTLSCMPSPETFQWQIRSCQVATAILIPTSKHDLSPVSRNLDWLLWYWVSTEGSTELNEQKTTKMSHELVLPAALYFFFPLNQRRDWQRFFPSVWFRILDLDFAPCPLLQSPATATIIQNQYRGHILHIMSNHPQYPLLKFLRSPFDIWSPWPAFSRNTVKLVEQESYLYTPLK